MLLAELKVFRARDEVVFCFVFLLGAQWPLTRNFGGARCKKTRVNVHISTDFYCISDKWAEVLSGNPPKN